MLPSQLNDSEDHGFAIEHLKFDIERHLGRAFKSPMDFDFLYRKLQEKTGETLSASTLMRLWSYVSCPSKPRRSTLSILARFEGFSDWDAYCAHLMRTADSESDFLTTKQIRACDLHPGDEVEMQWLPDRRLRVVFTGNQDFRVKEAENTRLCCNDTFACIGFSLNAPLYVHNLVHDGGSGLRYVAGRDNGLTSLTLIPVKNEKV